MTQCPSAFLGVQCQEPADHPGDHYRWDSSTHITTWDDRAADPGAYQTTPQQEGAQ